MNRRNFLKLVGMAVVSPALPLPVAAETMVVAEVWSKTRFNGALQGLSVDMVIIDEFSSVPDYFYERLINPAVHVSLGKDGLPVIKPIRAIDYYKKTE